MATENEPRHFAVGPNLEGLLYAVHVVGYLEGHADQAVRAALLEAMQSAERHYTLPHHHVEWVEGEERQGPGPYLVCANCGVGHSRLEACPIFNDELARHIDPNATPRLRVARPSEAI